MWVIFSHCVIACFFLSGKAVMVNGVPVTLPKLYSGSGLILERVGLFVSLSSRLGVTLLWDGGMSIRMSFHDQLLDFFNTADVMNSCLYLLHRNACLCPADASLAWPSRRTVWKFWRRCRKWLHYETRHHGIHSRTVWKLLEDQPVMSWRLRPGSPWPLCCE